MDRESGYQVVLADPGTGAMMGWLTKKGAESRTWILLSACGDEMVLDVDKYAIMHRVQIHARDLRILDPFLNYPSAILGRDRAIVLNLEHIKAIITANEVLLLGPRDEYITSVIEELQRRLKPMNDHHVIEDGVKEDEYPFEFRALEVALEVACSFISARTMELESAVYPALDSLTSKISSRNLDRVCKLKSQMTCLTGRVQKVRDELEQLLDDDDDMADLCFSRKLVGLPSLASMATIREDETMLTRLRCYWMHDSCKSMAP